MQNDFNARETMAKGVFTDVADSGKPCRSATRNLASFFALKECSTSFLVSDQP